MYPPRICHIQKSALKHTHKFFSICALPLPDILWPVGQQRGVVCPGGNRGLPSRLEARSEPSCAMDGSCNPSGTKKACRPPLISLQTLWALATKSFLDNLLLTSIYKPAGLSTFNLCMSHFTSALHEALQSTKCSVRDKLV